MMEPPTQYLGTVITIKIDPAIGSRHPEWGFIYPINYGYLPGVPAPDGEEMDAYRPGVIEPVEEYTGICIAVLHSVNDRGDELVVVPNHRSCSDKQIRALTEFQERFWPSEIIR